MPVIRTSHDYPPIPVRNFDWAAYLDNDEPDDNGNWSGPYGHGTTENEARDNLIAEIFEDMPEDHLMALVEALEAKAQADWTNREHDSASLIGHDYVQGVQSGYTRAINELMRLLNVEDARDG